jgi:hypothetical protein
MEGGKLFSTTRDVTAEKHRAQDLDRVWRHSRDLLIHSTMKAIDAILAAFAAESIGMGALVMAPTPRIKCADCRHISPRRLWLDPGSTPVLTGPFQAPSNVCVARPLERYYLVWTQSAAAPERSTAPGQVRGARRRRASQPK